MAPGKSWITRTGKIPFMTIVFQCNFKAQTGYWENQPFSRPGIVGPLIGSAGGDQTIWKQILDGLQQVLPFTRQWESDLLSKQLPFWKELREWKIKYWTCNCICTGSLRHVLGTFFPIIGSVSCFDFRNCPQWISRLPEIHDQDWTGPVRNYCSIRLSSWDLTPIATVASDLSSWRLVCWRLNNSCLSSCSDDLWESSSEISPRTLNWIWNGYCGGSAIAAAADHWSRRREIALSMSTIFFFNI